MNKYFRVLDKYDSYVDVMDYYMALLKIEQAGIIYANNPNKTREELRNKSKENAPENGLTKEEINLLTSPIPFARIVVNQAMTIIMHSFEKINLMLSDEPKDENQEKLDDNSEGLDNELKDENQDELNAKIEKIIEKLDDETKMILNKFLGIEENAKLKDIITHIRKFRNVGAHAKYSLAYKLPEDLEKFEELEIIDNFDKEINKLVYGEKGKKGKISILQSNVEAQNKDRDKLDKYIRAKNANMINNTNKSMSERKPYIESLNKELNQLGEELFVLNEFRTDINQDIDSISAEIRKKVTDNEIYVVIHNKVDNENERDFNVILSIDELKKLADACCKLLETSYEDRHVVLTGKKRGYIFHEGKEKERNVESKKRTRKILGINEKEYKEYKRRIKAKSRLSEIEVSFIRKYKNFIGIEKWNSLSEETKKRSLIKMLALVNSNTIYFKEEVDKDGKIVTGMIRGQDANIPLKKRDDKIVENSGIMPLRYFYRIREMAQQIKESTEFKQDENKRFFLTYDDFFKGIENMPESGMQLVRDEYEKYSAVRECEFFNLFNGAMIYQIGYLQEASKDKFYSSTRLTRVLDSVNKKVNGMKLFFDNIRNSFTHKRVSYDFDKYFRTKDLSDVELILRDMRESGRDENGEPIDTKVTFPSGLEGFQTTLNSRVKLGDCIDFLFDVKSELSKVPIDEQETNEKIEEFPDDESHIYNGPKKDGSLKKIQGNSTSKWRKSFLKGCTESVRSLLKLDITSSEMNLVEREEKRLREEEEQTHDEG